MPSNLQSQLSTDAPSKKGAGSEYRADIDGMRAVAVLLVIVFHAFPSHLKGGFVGVDIFFVISGFLISGILLKELRRGTIHFTNFYARRVRRIFPALITVLGLLLVLGCFVLIPEELKQFGKHVAVASVFGSNFLLWSEVGYFDNLADTKPLLHLWSLGIEEQFYLVYPLLLWLAWKARVNLFVAMTVVFSISFAWNLSRFGASDGYQFYSPQTRFWELMVGSMIAFAVVTRPPILKEMRLWSMARIGRLCSLPTVRVESIARHSLAGVGLGLIVLGALSISPNDSYPGVLALLPTLGAALLIATGPDTLVGRRILSHPIIVWFGIISFPLYLWHWPLLSFQRLLNGETPSAILRLGVVLLSVLLAWITTKLIESPLRFGRYQVAKVSVLLGAIVVIGSAGFGIYKKDGFIRFSLLANTRTGPAQSIGSVSKEANLTQSPEPISSTSRSATPASAAKQGPPADHRNSSMKGTPANAISQASTDSPSSNINRPILPPGVVNDGDLGHDIIHKYVADKFYPCTPEAIYKQALSWAGLVRCQQSKPSEPIEILLLGDSHAEHLFLGLVEALPKKQIGYYIQSAVPVLSSPEFKLIFDTVAETKEIKTVILTAWWYGRGVPKAELKATLNFLLAKGKKVYITDDVPTFFFDPAICKYEGRLPGSSPRCTQETPATGDPNEVNLRALAEIVEEDPRVTLIKTMKYLCQSGACFMGKDGQLLYRDQTHLNINGSRLVGKKIVAEYPELRR
ncbi:MAG TPA: acyltransferase family protein [Bryobacteraceae bacterium]|nr:acyltransferase family protein [Bryobacteraceae bacterium]